VVVLAVVVAALSTVAAVVGLLVTGGVAPRTVTSVHGDLVELYGTGVYRADTVFKGAGNRGSDVVTLLLAVPLLLVATSAYRRGSLRGALLLSGALSWPLYLYATMAVGAAYNELFLVYVAIFYASQFALVLTLRSVDRAVLAARMASGGRRGTLAALMLGGGVVTTVVWLMPLIAAGVAGDPPELLGHQTTMVTDALDLGVITPATLLAAYLLHRRRPEGYLVAFPLLVLMTFLLPMIVAQTAFQLRADVSFTVGEIVGPVGGFVVLAALGLGLVVAVLRAAGDASVQPMTRGRSLTDQEAASGAGRSAVRRVS
jgi:hypothetical protein